MKVHMRLEIAQMTWPPYCSWLLGLPAQQGQAMFHHTFGRVPTGNSFSVKRHMLCWFACKSCRGIGSHDSNIKNTHLLRSEEGLLLHKRSPSSEEVCVPQKHNRKSHCLCRRTLSRYSKKPSLGRAFMKICLACT